MILFSFSQNELRYVEHPKLQARKSRLLNFTFEKQARK